MKVDYDFMLKQIDEEIVQIDGLIAAEKLAGNTVKEAAEQGERVAFQKLKAWIERLRNIEAPDKSVIEQAREYCKFHEGINSSDSTYSIVAGLLQLMQIENDETGHELVAAKATIAEQAETIAKHEKLMSEDVHIEKLNYEDGRLDIRGTHPLASALIAEVVSIFVSGGSENYFEIQGYHPQTGPMTFTIQRTEGKSPGQVAHECREELRLLKEKVGI